jgi:polyisoprenoid-binding protein YceI
VATDINQKPGLATWTIDPMHSTAEFSVKHMMISTVKGRFGVISGAIQYDGSDLTTASVEATIDVSSISTDQPQRDEHLRSADFFHVEEHSNITFKSTGVELVEDNEYRVRGDLTIHGVTHPVTLDTVYEGQITDPYGNRRAGFAAETTLSRKDYGLTYNAVLEAGGMVIGDKIKVAIHLEAIRQA